MNLEAVKIEMPEGCNLIFGMTHFIKSVEDLHEMMVNSVPGVKFGLAFSEASGDRLVRYSGNDPGLAQAAADNVKRFACGHCFLIFMRDGYPVNVLQSLKNVYEVVTVFCATANPVEAVIARTAQGGAILGVVDGEPPLGIEDDVAKQKRHAFLRTIGYKL
ncbi:MAG: adenosine-specific kinase [candidate division Zixibacteria bacterium]|nr:adenosine-specific kinase [candidate division Zixibacteria bacterium]